MVSLDIPTTYVAPYLPDLRATQLLDINFGFARSQVLATALELRIFTHIAHGSVTSDELAIVTNCSQWGIARLLDALVGMGLICCNGQIYNLSPLAATYLVAERPCYLGAHLDGVMEQWNLWRQLTDAVRTGEPVRDISAPGGRSRYPALFTHLFPLIFPVAWQAAGQLALPEQAHVLDIAAGSAAWSIALALRHPQATLLAQDEPDLLATTRTWVTQFNLTDRFVYREAHPEDIVLAPMSFHLILVCHICRFIGQSRSQALFQECYQLLQPGGMLLLADVMLNDQRTSPPASLLIGLSMLLNTQQGAVFTESDYRTWLVRAGFRRIENPLDAAPLLLARR